MTAARKAYTLVEILIVVTILSIIFIAGYRSIRTVSNDAVQLSRAAASSRKAEFDRLVGILNDRLGQAWSYTLAPAANGGTLNLFDANGTNYAQFTLTSPDDLTFTYTMADITTTYTANPLTLTYVYTNQETTNFLMRLVTSVPALNFTNVTVSWQIPPPLFFDADLSAFQGLFLADSQADLQSQVAQHRTNHTGLLQHDLRNYNWNPRQQALR